MIIDQQRSTQSSAYFATSGGYEPNSGILSRQICGENEEFVSKRQLMNTTPPKTRKLLQCYRDLGDFLLLQNLVKQIEPLKSQGLSPMHF